MKQPNRFCPHCEELYYIKPNKLASCPVCGSRLQPYRCDSDPEYTPFGQGDNLGESSDW